MKLGKKGKKEDEFEARLAAEGQAVSTFGAGAEVDEEPSGGRRSTGAAPEPDVEVGPVHIKIEERIALEANRDGGLESMEIKGIMQTAVHDPAFARCKIRAVIDSSKGVSFQTHPNVDKKQFAADSSIVLKSNRPYPNGSEVGVLKWRIQTTDESMIPLTINCWPNVNADGSADVNIDYELVNTDLTLTDVVIMIPIPSAPTVNSVDGEYSYEKRDGVLEWQIPEVTGDNAEGSMEFTVQAGSADEFFPVSVNFSSEKTFAGLEIEVVETADGDEVDYTSQVAFTVDSYDYV